MAFNSAKCFEIETAGLILGWSFVFGYIIVLFLIIGFSCYGMYSYISGRIIQNMVLYGNNTDYF